MGAHYKPVHVSDVAWAVVQAWETSATIGRQFNISGAAPSLNGMVYLTAQALGHCVNHFHIPVQPMVAALQVSERLGITLPIKAEQILRLNGDKAFPMRRLLMRADTPQWHLIKALDKVALLRTGGDGLIF